MNTINVYLKNCCICIFSGKSIFINNIIELDEILKTYPIVNFYDCVHNKSILPENIFCIYSKWHEQSHSDDSDYEPCLLHNKFHYISVRQNVLTSINFLKSYNLHSDFKFDSKHDFICTNIKKTYVYNNKICVENCNEINFNQGILIYDPNMFGPYFGMLKIFLSNLGYQMEELHANVHEVKKKSLTKSAINFTAKL